MAWDTEETQRRLKQAATEEFAAAGLHGTTVDGIAKRAGVNKERLYNYFGNKEQLFATILSDELAKAAHAVPLEALDVVDVGDVAGRIFDYHLDHPQLVRLLHWEGLTDDGKVPDEHERTKTYQDKVRSCATAQREGMLDADPAPAHLLFLILALAGWWFAVPQVARMLAGPDTSLADRARQREAVVWAARALALPRDAVQQTAAAS